MSEPGELGLEPEWALHPKTWGHPFHATCSYMAMFPARIPHYFVQKFTRPGDAVLDPFCGRGTTPLQACAEGRVGIGVDLNPLAHVLTLAKIQPPDKEALLARLEDLENDMFYADVAGEPDEIRMLFHDRTLSQLVHLKRILEMDDPRDRFILATIAGALHGAPHSGGRTSSYLSISMPNTFSMAPNYIRNYIAAKGLEKMPIDVFDVLRRRFDRLFRHGPPLTPGFAYRGNARHLLDIPDRRLKRKEVKLIMSSPPYLKVVKYGLYNWIRFWLLDEDPGRLDTELDQHPRLDDYLLFMHRVCQQLFRVMATGGVCVLLIGDVKRPRDPEPVNLALEVWKFLKRRKTRFQLAGILEDRLPENAKVTRIWGDEKRGKATLIDRALVLYKDRYEPSPHRVAW